MSMEMVQEEKTYRNETHAEAGDETASHNQTQAAGRDGL